MSSCLEMVWKYSENVAPTSRRKYTGAVKRFVDFAGGDFGRERLLAYIKHLQNEGYSPNTISRFDLTAIRRFYKVNGLEWPLKRWELPSVSERDIYAPALHQDVIAKLVATARAGKVPRGDAALLALSTTYGLRRVEMTTLRPHDVDWEHKVLFIRTAKHGRERLHIMPEALVPYLKAGLGRPLSPTQASKAFYRLEVAAGLRKMPEVGWHGIRRALTRALVEANLPEAVIRNFLRWKRSSDDMLLRYHATTVVGEDGTFTDPGRRDREVDEMVFKVHPFLRLWEG